MEFGDCVDEEVAAFGGSWGETQAEGEGGGVDVGVYVRGEGARWLCGKGGFEGEVEADAGLAGVRADVGWLGGRNVGRGGDGWEEEAVGFGDVEVGGWW